MSAEFPGAGGSWAPLPDEPAGPGRNRRPFWARRSVVISSVAALALVGGAGAAYAASGGAGSAIVSTAAAAASPSPSQSGTAPGNRHFRGFGSLGFGPGMFGAVHGQLVVPRSGGGYQTVDVQTGTVTAVSATSITLKSADGFTLQYAVTSSTIVDGKRDTIGSVKSGDKVFVLATVSGSSATAVRIMDSRLIGQFRAGADGDWPGHRGMPFPGGAPGTSGFQAPPV